MEMAAAFDRAGFAAVDVHMSDILAGRIISWRFQTLVACGGFSYGDVLGRVKAGPSPSCSTTTPVSSSSASSSAAIPSPWGVQRLPDDVQPA